MIELSGSQYLRERLTPLPGDEFYIPLSDTLESLRMLAPFDAKRVLDYGCGGSPYRQLFSGEYLRADIALNPDRDITLLDGSRLPPDLSDLNLILSTQVLEHVEDPQQYLAECWRVLAPGGALFLSTHGLFEDHGSPNDYWRWTAEGLVTLLTKSGFVVEDSLKVTCGPRASLFFLERDLRMMGPGRNVTSIFPTLFAIMRGLSRKRMHVFSDKQYSQYRICAGMDAGTPGRYLGIALRARKSGVPQSCGSR